MENAVISEIERDEIYTGVNTLVRVCNRLAVQGGWWHNPETGEPLARNKGEMFALMHSEISEAMEGERKGLMDDHLPDRPSVEVELGDTVIRIGDYAGGFKHDLAGAILDKLEYNARRLDHKPENRVKAGGKKF